MLRLYDDDDDDNDDDENYEDVCNCRYIWFIYIL